MKAWEILSVDVAVCSAATCVGFGGEFDTFAADGKVQTVCGGEERVAHGFEVEATTIESPEEIVLGIEFLGGGAGDALLLIGAGGHDEAMEFLERPAIPDETGGEIVEELGV